MQAAIAKLLQKNEGILNKAKQKLKEEGEKGILKLKSKIPTQAELMDKLTNNSCSAEGISKSEKNYQKLKGKAKSIQNIIEGAKKSLEALKRMIQKVLDIIAKVTAIIASIASIIMMLSAVVNVAKILINGIGMLPSTQYFPIPAGPIILADKAATAAKGVIDVLKASVKSFTKALSRPAKIAAKIMAIIIAAIAALSLILNLINMILQMLETLFLTMLNNCAISNPGGDNNQTANIVEGQTPEEYLAGMGYPGYIIDNTPLEDKNPYDYSDPLATYYESIIANLKLAGANEVIEKIYNAKFEMIGYRRYGIMGMDDPSFTEKIDDRRFDD
jgi:hypothetical protein